MKKLILIPALLLISMTTIQCHVSKKIDSLAEEEKENNESKYSKNTLIIYFEPSAKESVFKEIKKYGAEIKYNYESLNGAAITIPKNKTLEESEKYLKNIKGILEVNRDQIMTIH
ncbi:hypothetical protein SAMN05443634_105118 [Chishuiella changwenlii]|uniref:Fervidolysin-like N-terminal prodomain domain-containing protein n=1 Tax=Chishuiella changwenlii TaxID=1434701 RepID=A0A1M6X5D2_9FLAO|nr:hypothetical protein [Chishuiella changwenlii]GGE98114.1 hypothetical protein GCM10010984_14600 [Chishuiella changwenlii]SHL01124.1 hypothetical protein SAMN05443634_105118 [Chishuiella changwenlii]